MPKLTVNGKAIEVAEGTNLIEAAKAAGVEVPHYCYHPALSIDAAQGVVILALDAGFAASAAWLTVWTIVVLSLLKLLSPL